MKHPTKETLQRLQNYFYILEETIEKIGDIIHPENLIEWAEETSLDSNASQEHLDAAAEILEFSDKFCI